MIWTVEPGRALHRNGVYQLHVGPAHPVHGLPPADLDLMTHHIARLLNADEAQAKTTPVVYREKEVTR